MSSLKEAYQLSLSLADQCWASVQLWSMFDQTLIGKPLIRALDHYSLILGQALLLNQKKQSWTTKSLAYLTASVIWLEKARRRKALAKEEYQSYYQQLQRLFTITKPRSQD